MVTINGRDLTVEQVAAVARKFEKVRISSESVPTDASDLLDTGTIARKRKVEGARRNSSIKSMNGFMIERILLIRTTPPVRPPNSESVAA